MLKKPSSFTPNEVRWGDSTTERGPSTFAPQYDVIAYFGFGEDNKLYSSVQYFATQGANYGAIRQSISRCIATLDAANLETLPSCPGSLKTSNFNDFTFKAPSNVVFVSRKPALRFQEGESLVLSRSLLTAHPGYNDGAGVPIEDRKKAKPNKSFYGATLFQEGNRKILYVRNHHTRKSGNNDNATGHGNAPIGNSVYWYGMNLFMTNDQGAGGEPATTIVDPDGGNMGSGNP